MASLELKPAMLGRKALDALSDVEEMFRMLSVQ